MKKVIAAIFFLVTIFVCEQPIRSRPLAGGIWHYEVTAGTNAQELRVEATLPPGLPAELSVSDGAESYLQDAEIAIGDDWRPLKQGNLSWFLPPTAQTRGCRIRYRYRLVEAARDINDIDIAKLSNNTTVLGSPSAWLLKPVETVRNHHVTFHVTPPPGWEFVSGVFPVTKNKNTYGAASTELKDMSYSAFGKLRLYTIEVTGGKLDVAIAPGNYTVNDSMIVDWVTKAGKAVSNYYGRLPLPRVLVIVRATSGRGIDYGTALGNAGAAISIIVGATSRADDFASDWTLTHELVHIGFPSVPRNRHAWMEEGMATYVEPIARLRTGLLSPETVWNEWVTEMPSGLPGLGDRGLDYTPTWERTYWGGALFCFVADIEIRKRTNNRYGLEDAFQGIVAAGGTINSDWSITRALTAGDRATGVPVLMELYNKMKATPVNVDLDDLWQRLGVERRNGRIIFNDKAPLADIRQAINTGKGRR